MRLKVHLGGATIRKWHIDLLTKLGGRADLEVSATVALDPVSIARAKLPHHIEILFQLEKLIHRIADGGPASLAPHGILEPYLDGLGPSDLVLDLAGDAQAIDGIPVWRLTYNGISGEVSLIASLMNGLSPVAEILERQSVIVAGRLGTEYNGIALSSFEDALARTITLITAAFAGAATKALPSLAKENSRKTLRRSISPPFTTAFAAKEVTQWAIKAIYRFCYNSPHWRVGWRKLTGPDTIELGDHPISGWRDLPDDGTRFYADPFPLLYQGKLTLFVEDFEHRKKKGVISAVSFGPNGPAGKPEPVLELSYHLSYPFVFAEDGQAWMIPESSASGTIDLFRATCYPGGWIKEATLVSSVVASDPTLFRHAGGWWLLATVRDNGGAFSDVLHIWFAENFRGPWTSHPQNPVLIDIASARPGGRTILRDGKIFRPVQDCRLGYGQALGIARILTLDKGRFEQTVDTIITAGSAWRGRRVHTLNSAGGFEFIDGSARSALAFGFN